VIAFATTETAKPSTASRNRLQRTIVYAIRPTSRGINPQWFQGAQESLRQTGSASPTCDAVMRSRRGQSILLRAAISFRGCHQLPPIVIDVELFTVRIPVSPP
jgi:hypothetical protein